MSTANSWVGPGEFIRAFGALGKLAQDPNRTEYVGDFIGLLTGPSAGRLYRRFWNDPVGRRLLEERKDLRATLSDLEYLSSLPAGSFGRAYLEWAHSRSFSADGIADAISHQVGREIESPYATMAARVVDMHDLWHVLNGWDSDVGGEVHLLGYSYAQLGAWAWLALGAMASLALAASGRFEGVGYLRDSIRRGRKAPLLVAVDWEALLPLPLEEVRRQLGIDEPTPYRKVHLDALQNRKGKT